MVCVRIENGLQCTIVHVLVSLSSPSKQVGLARGNINPLTMEVMDTYSPSKLVQTKASGSLFNMKFLLL